MIEYVLLTHIHKDHFNKKSIVSLHFANKNIKFICCEWLREPLEKIGIKPYVIELNTPIKLKNAVISAFSLYHDVENCGWRINFDGFKLIHATDTQHMDGIEAVGYQAYFIEANHSEEQIDREIKQAQVEGRYTHKIGAKNSHLSIEKANEFIMNNWNGEAIIRYLHVSSDFDIDNYKSGRYEE